MKFQFDAKLPFQLDAINAVVDIFKGQSINKGAFEINLQERVNLFNTSLVQTELGLGNFLQPTDNELNENVKQIQKFNNIHQKETIEGKGRNFSIEMETGTGKTYVYLRTAFELNAKYGFKKFIIVVPSVAIREGVLKSIEMMQDHFKDLYDNIPFNHFVYNSKRVNELRGYAAANQMQLMIINIDSFNKKDINIIHDIRDKMGGRKPIEYIQAAHPIVILDEPQSMESPVAKAAIKLLNPLLTLRYSATHRDKYNLMYQLDPIRAFQMRLVKKISVASVVAENDANAAFIKANAITNKDGRIRANLSFHKQTPEGPKITKATLRQDDDLFMKSNEREVYRNGFIITEINARPGMEYVKFSNGIRIQQGEERGSNRDEIVKEQIRQTIKAHFEKELQVKDTGIKVLSLFFLDKVANYRIYSDKGWEKGPYAKLFEELYTELKEEYRTLFNQEILPAEDVHNGYFSMDRVGGKEQFKDTTGKSAKDDETYHLIMRDKEKLLGLDNPLKFIFSHSALREGWDNPNIFQICTLNVSTSTIKKRQEIGRGLRLPVNQNGERIFDEYINNLVVVANESYNDFATGLQSEFEKEGVIFGKLPIEAFVGIQYKIKDKDYTISIKESGVIWDSLNKQGIIKEDGIITDEFQKAVDEMTIEINEEFKIIKYEIIKTIEKYQLENHIENYHKKVKGHINEQVLLDPEFELFWNTINTKTIYSVHYSTEELIDIAVKAIMKMERIEPPKIRSSLADIEVETTGVHATLVQTPTSIATEKFKNVPDILTYIQGKTELTRRTIFEILNKSQRLKDFSINPQQFMDAVVVEIRNVLNRMIVEGIKYERLEGITYEMSRLREDEHKLNFSNERIVPTKKSVYDYIYYDSGVEKKFVEGLNNLKNIKYFIKLPVWFKVPTPIGDYNPDWAILKQNGDIVYMIRETKGTKDQFKLRISESDKIHCGKQHFESIGIDFDVATSIEDANL